ncbi:MAG: hypothetical protein C0600_12275 [Ignavibacteria bacterium]|nr:MAG: hypothetical protein C0600_12275 [Ignavibacteria bacterium]
MNNRMNCIVVLAVCAAVFCPVAHAQVAAGVALEYDGPDTLVLTAGEPVCFELVARDSLGNVVTGWDTLGSAVTISIAGSTAAADTSDRTWNHDPEGYSWNRIYFEDQAILQISAIDFSLTADRFRDGRAEICLRSTKAEANIHLEITPYAGFVKQKSPVMTFVPDTLANFLVDLTDPFRDEEDVMYRYRPFEVLVISRDRYLNTVVDSIPVFATFTFPGEFGDQPPGPWDPNRYDIWRHSLLDSDLSVPFGVTHFFAFPTISREKGADAGHRITFTHSDKSYIRGVCDAFFVADHAPSPFEQLYPPDETHINLATAADDSTITFRWRIPVPREAYVNAMISRFDPATYSDDIAHSVVFYDRNTGKGGGATAWTPRSAFGEIASSLSITVADFRSHLLSARPEWNGEAAELMWYAVATDTTYETPASNVLADSSRGFRIYVNMGTSAVDDPPAASGIVLKQNYPNPFNPTTTIQYILQKPQRVSLMISDLYGREVHRLVSNVYREAGSHHVHFEAGSLPSGLYYYSLIAGGQRLTRKMVLLR